MWLCQPRICDYLFVLVLDKLASNVVTTSREENKSSTCTARWDWPIGSNLCAQQVIYVSACGRVTICYVEMDRKMFEVCRDPTTTVCITTGVWWPITKWVSTYCGCIYFKDNIILNICIFLLQLIMKKLFLFICFSFHSSTFYYFSWLKTLHCLCLILLTLTSSHWWR